MSLLEDIFLQDEADEAQQLERIIEGDEFEDEKPNRDENSDSDDNSEKEDEATEDKRRVDPSSTKTKRVVKNPRVTLNPARLTGPRGIQVIPDHFKDFKFKGKGHEKDDLDMVLKKLEHWAYRLYPKFQFEDCLKKIETLGKKRPVMVHLHKIRSDQLLTEETVVQKDSSDDEPVPQVEDEFDKLLQQQIDIARATPAPGSVHKPDVTSTPMVDRRSSLTAPKATASPSISDEQRERIIRNRKLAEERRLARMKAQNGNQGGDKIKRVLTNEKRLDVINSDDEDVEITNANKPIAEENHNNANDNNANDEDIRLGKVSNVVIDLDVADNETVKISKKHKTNVIDSSDENDEMPEKNRQSKSLDDVIDITHNNVNDNITDDKITEDISLSKVRSNNVIDLDMAETETVKVSKKHNEENVIDGSDENGDVLETNCQSKSIYNIIDITEGYKPSKIVDNELINLSNVGGEVTGNISDELNHRHANNASHTANLDNVIDITGKVVTNLKTIDEKKYQKVNKNGKLNKSNIIDSSDDDNSCDVLQVDQIVTADVHDMVIDDKIGRNGKLFDNNLEKSKTCKEVSNIEINDCEHDGIGTLPDNKISGATKVTNNVTENNVEVNNGTETNVLVDDLNPADDLMDVDFTDDF